MRFGATAFIFAWRKVHREIWSRDIQRNKSCPRRGRRTDNTARVSFARYPRSSENRSLTSFANPESNPGAGRLALTRAEILFIGGLSCRAFPLLFTRHMLPYLLSLSPDILSVLPVSFVAAGVTSDPFAVLTSVSVHET